jgi:DNA-binding NarL/FixJ family response regulator
MPGTELCSVRGDSCRSTIVIIEPRILFRECLLRCLSEATTDDIILGYASVAEWLKHRSEETTTCLIVLSVADRWEVDIASDLALLSQSGSTISVVVLSDKEDAVRVLAALERGVRGYIPTNVPLRVAVEAIRLVSAGGIYIPAGSLRGFEKSTGSFSEAAKNSYNDLFTPKQLAVLAELQVGKPNKVIASKLNMRESTVKVHVSNIMKKLKATNRTEVVFRISSMNANNDKDQALGRMQ